MANYFLVNRKKGFTLLELLIVIALIGILVSIGVASYSQAQRKARDARRQGDLKSIQAAWEQYYADNSGSYPASCAISTTYLPGGIPKDPKSPTQDYTETCATASYCFCATLEGSAQGNSTTTDCSSFTSGGTTFCVKQLQ